MKTEKAPATPDLSGLILSSEDWLMNRILYYAKTHDYTRYTSTLVEAWRLSVSGISGAIAGTLKIEGDTPPEFTSSDTYSDNPVAAFAVEEARRHRERGVSLKLFLGLFKYYRQSYLDLIREKVRDHQAAIRFETFIIRSFDLFELALCVEWNAISEPRKIEELQNTNRQITNEKNKYLSLFESLSDPVFLLNADDEIDHLNLAACRMLGLKIDPGGFYYTGSDPKRAVHQEGGDTCMALAGKPILQILPWLKKTINAPPDGTGRITNSEVETVLDGRRCFYMVSIAAMRDVSDKYKGSILVLTDITDLKLVQTKLEINEARLTLATRAGGIGVWEWDLVNDRLIWDDRMMALYQMTDDTFSKTSDAWVASIHPEDLDQTDRRLREAMRSDGQFGSEFRITLPGGAVRNVQAAGQVQYSEDKKPVRMIGVNWDITDQKKLEEKIITLASTDSLTGVSNRRYFMEQAHKECVRSARYKTPLSILMLDIDHFKKINDAYGHPMGDFALKKFCEICQGMLRENDILGRLGGEEFAVLLVQTDLGEAEEIARRLRQSVADAVIEKDEVSFAMTVSIGVSLFVPEHKTIDPGLHLADQALYRAKRNGRNRVVFAGS